MAQPWGTGDEIAVGTGLMVLGAGMLLPKNRTRERAAVLLANGIALGPLLLIVASPLPQMLGYRKPDLLEIALNEGRATIFWAATYAIIQLLLDVF